MQLPFERFIHLGKKASRRVYLRQPVQGRYQIYTWESASHEARSVVSYLQSLGIQKRSAVGILSKNCAHWMMSDLAIQMAGLVSVPIYPNLTAEHIREILIHSDARALFVGKLDNWESLKAGIPNGLPCIAFPYGIPDYPQWNDIVKNTPSVTDPVPSRPNDLATIIYTSGTTGNPKGVMHSFGTMACASVEITRVMKLTEKDRFFSYLPLAHVAERLLVEMLPLYCGGTVSFVESLDTFTRDLVATRPTIFLGVPRIWNKFQTGIWNKVPQEKLDGLLKIPVLSSFVRRKIKKGLGLDAARYNVVGAAPSPIALLEWFSRLEILIQEAYGMTENFAYSHLNPKEGIRLGTVGVPWPHVDVRLSPEGEILVKSQTLCSGLYKDEAGTRGLFENGYLKTGDQGEIDSQGYLKITGRAKDLFKTSKGKYVAPAPLELKISANSDIEQCCIVGPGLAQPIVLVSLSEAAKKKPRETVESGLLADLQNINQTLDAHEQIDKIVIVKENWTVENSFLTPTLKIKRPAIERYYNKFIRNWVEENRTVVWASEF